MYLLLTIYSNEREQVICPQLIVTQYNTNIVIILLSKAIGIRVVVWSGLLNKSCWRGTRVVGLAFFPFICETNTLNECIDFGTEKSTRSVEEG